MKVEIDVDPGQVGQSLKDVLGSLTLEERRALAVKTMESWLRDPYDVERVAKERWAVDEVKAKYAGEYGGPKDDQAARQHYRFREMMEKWRSTKEIMVETITREIVDHYKAEVKRTVETDPKIQAMKDEIVKVMIETFPKIAHDAMTLWVASNFQNMFLATANLEAQVKQMGETMNGVSQRLFQIGSRVGM